MRKLIALALLTSTFHLSYAQTGPADIGENNIIWLEANDLSGPLADGFTWSDKTSNGFDAVEISGGSVPTLVSIGTNQYLRFAGAAGEQLTIADDNATTNLLDGASEFTVIAVFNTGATDVRAVISKRENFSNRSWALFYNDGFDMYGYVGATTVGGSASVAAASNPYIATMTVDAALSGGSVQMFVNSASGGSTGSNLSIPDLDDDIIIGTFQSGDTRYFDGDIAEIIVYRDALNNGERRVLENYLSQKYNITVSNDLYGNDTDYAATYDNDIRGIGTGNGTDLHSESGFSSGLQISANAGLDNTDEFVLIGHDQSIGHADGSTSNIAMSDIMSGDITERWAKDYYLEATQGGVIDAASVDVQFTFDFSEAGLTYSGSPTDYVLLYRPNTSADFERVFAESYVLENGDQIVANIPANRILTGYYTLGRGGQLTSRTWYVLQDGNWADATTWTLDAGAAPVPNNPMAEIPGEEDMVVIRSGKTVTVQGTNNDLDLGGITVDGVLDLTTSTGHDFLIINGEGTIRLSGSNSSTNFPIGITTGSNGFGNPANGGLLVIEGTGTFVFDQDATFRNVRVERTNATDEVHLGADLTINGDLTVRFGTFQFGDGSGANRTLTVIRDFNVENNGGSQDGRVVTANVAASNTRHEFNLYGNFLNEGTAQFSDRTTETFGSESANGVVDLNLVATNQDQNVDCNGQTYFYRIEIDKGSVDYTAFIQADDPSNFVLTGFANNSTAGDITTPTDNPNAFGLITGTASVGTNVSVRLNTTGNYSIGSNAKLLVNGGNVTKTGGAAITPYGTIEVTAGILEVPTGSGLTTRATGQIIVSGGELWTPQIRTSIQGAAEVGGYTQTGGVANIYDYDVSESPNLQFSGEAPNNDYTRFCLTYEGNSFVMTGGTLNVKDETTQGLIFINSDPSNINVTGGTVNVYSDGGTDGVIASNAGFWDLNIIQESTGRISVNDATCGPGGADDRTISDPDLRVLHDLRIEANGELIMNDHDLYVGEDFILADNDPDVDYQPGNNTTYFNGNLSGELQINSTGVLNADTRINFNNVVVDKPEGNGLFVTGTTPNYTNNQIFRINGDFTLESGLVNQGERDIDLNGNNITVKGTMGVYEPGVSEGVILLRNNNFTLVTTDEAQFGYVRDNNTNTITLTSDVYIQRLWWRQGLWDIGTHNVRVDRLDIRPNNTQYDDDTGSPVCTNCLNVDYMFATAGNESDGGLSILIPQDGINDGHIQADWGVNVTDYEGNIIGNTAGGNPADNLFIYPVGIGTTGEDADYFDTTNPVDPNAISKYTPVYLTIDDVTGVTEDVYVTVRPVDGELQTTELTGGNILSYYWNIEESYTGTAPTVSISTNYYLDDLDGQDPEQSFVPGMVQDGGTYDRSFEDGAGSEFIDNTDDDDFIQVISFDGQNDNDFTLESVNFTAGVTARFVGAPTIYDTRNGASYTTQWDEQNGGNYEVWSIAGEDGVAIPIAQGLPGPGDIVRINGGHRIEVDHENNNGLSWAGLVMNGGAIDFTNRNRGSANPGGSQFPFDGNANIGSVSGTGTILFSTASLVTTFPNGDYGDFTSNNTNTFLLRITADYSQPMPTNISEFPRTTFFGGESTDALSGNRIFQINNDLIINGSSTVLAGAVLELGGDNLGNGGTLSVSEGMRIGNNGSSRLGIIRFPNAGSPWTFRVGGDLIVDYSTGGTSRLEVETGGSFVEHKVIVEGDLQQLNGGEINLNETAKATLELQGESDNSYSKDAGSTPMPDLYKIVMNKGNDLTYSFTFNDEINLDAPSVSGVQPIEIINGLLALNNTDIDITLADGTVGDFYLPNVFNSDASSGSGGLHVANGTVRINGDDVGLQLDGLLRVSGDGIVEMGDDLGGTTNGNNFIQYGSSGNAVIEVQDNAELSVGSQVRRSTLSTAGILRYDQSGGTAHFGINAAPESTRGVFEIINSDSEFNISGGEFAIARQNGSTTVGSLIVKPDADDIDITGGNITFGTIDTPPGQNDIGIDATVPLSNIVVANNNNPGVKIYNNPLEVTNITLQANTTFDANGIDLSLTGDLTNDGVFTNSGDDINGQTTFLTSSGTQNLTGSGTTNFYNLTKSGSGTLNVGKEITVDNDLELQDGTTSTATFAFNVIGDMVHNATHESDPAGPGIVFNGAEAQNLSNAGGTAYFGVLTVDNGNGVEIPSVGQTFEVDDKVVLTTGVLNIGGNLLVMDNDAFFESATGTGRTDFNANNMISVNASITDNGVRKIYPESFTGTYLYPVGLNYYTPAEINVTGISSVGNANIGQITIKPIEDIAGGIPDDFDEICIDIVETGTADGTAPNTLIHSGQNFNSTVDIGDVVENTTDGTFAIVTSIDSDTQLTLDGDIIESGEDYQIGPNFVDIDNILQFYWLIKSTDIDDFDGSFTLYHVDALESVDNNEGLTLANYAPARLLDNTSNWDRAYSETLFDEVNNSMTFQLSSGIFQDFLSEDITGTYTAGITRDNSDGELCGGAIPPAVPEYITLATGTGDIDQIGSYDTAPGGTPPTLGESPDLRVQGNFVLNLTDQFWRFRRIVVESGATLSISGAGVNLGTVTGEGTIRLFDTNALPAGDYDSFYAPADCSTGGGFEYQVSSMQSVTVGSGLSRVRRLIFSGDGDKVLANNSSIDICENIEIQNAGQFAMGDDTDLEIQGNLIKASTASFDGDFSNALLVFNGSSQQQIDGSFTGSEMLRSFELNNSAGMTVVNVPDDNVEVEQLVLTNGRVTTDADNSLIILSTGDVTGNFSSTTFVDGPLVRRLETSTDSEIFPVGNAGVYQPFEISNTQGYGGTEDWTVEYYDENPTTSSRITNVNGNTDFGTFDSEVATANSLIFEQDLWEVNVTAAATADVRPYWDSDSDVGDDATDWGQLRVMAWSTGDEEWESYGNDNADFIGMTSSRGSVVSSNDLTFGTNFVTLATLGAPITLPVELLSFDAQLIESVVELSWTTAAEIDNDYFEIERSYDGENYVVIGTVSGNGNTNEQISYTFTDHRPIQGVSYYRLVQFDFDGDYEIHRAISINNSLIPHELELDLYPNPTSSDNINIRLSNVEQALPATIAIFDLEGRTVYHRTVDTNLGNTNHKIIPYNRLRSGIYQVIVYHAGQRTSQKIIIN